MKIVQDLPFTVVLSRKNETFERLFATRLRSYNRHEHEVKSSDHFKKHLVEDNAIVMSAESKTSGECVGSVRIESNTANPFYFEKEITTSDLKGRTSAVCISRLNVLNGPEGRLVRAAICKSLYLYAHALQCRYMYAFVDKARSRLYTTLGFEPALSNNPSLELKCHGLLPLHLYRSPVDEAMERLPGLNPAMYDFLFNTYHPDIRIFSAISSRTQIRRISDHFPHPAAEKGVLLPSPTV